MHHAVRQQQQQNYFSCETVIDIHAWWQSQSLSYRVNWRLEQTARHLHLIIDLIFQQDGILGEYSGSLHTPVYDTKSSMRCSSLGGGGILSRIPYSGIFDNIFPPLVKLSITDSLSRTINRSHFIRTFITKYKEIDRQYGHYSHHERQDYDD